MTNPQIRNTEDLRKFMQENKGDGIDITDDDLIWFVCRQYAYELLESCNNRDVASMFRRGVQPTNALEHVQEYIDERFPEGAEEYFEEYNTALLVSALRFLGQDDKALLLELEDEE